MPPKPQTLILTDLSEEGAPSEKPEGTEKVEGLIAIALYHTWDTESEERKRPQNSSEPALGGGHIHPVIEQGIINVGFI